MNVQHNESMLTTPKQKKKGARYASFFIRCSWDFPFIDSFQRQPVVMCLLATIQRPGSFLCVTRMSEVTTGSDSFAMQNSCLAARKLNNKGEDMMAVAASPAGDSYATSQKHGA